MNWINSCAVLLLLASLIFVPSCYYDNEEELYPFVECDTTAVTYTETVLPVLENNCYVCHSAAANLGGITLEGYQNLLTYVNSGRFLGAIRRQEGFSPMPQNASQLPDCTLDQIEAWINLGAPEN
ncbi:MAG: hypothetical protein KDC43_27785 [Saprospiraceae bacterium]|nr:hypothetical protein [Saprospiraceae bacterium]MCB0627620.1 hypothetical protein [Saprospiraceae bacterium]MCB0677697.1 hypothetical protein [Saprospiraceae bacterium]MCB0683097.1 hypothetical protein [Saprospiraceae bacterium]